MVVAARIWLAPRTGDDGAGLSSEESASTIRRFRDLFGRLMLRPPSVSVLPASPSSPPSPSPSPSSSPLLLSLSSSSRLTRRRSRPRSRSREASPFRRLKSVRTMVSASESLESSWLSTPKPDKSPTGDVFPCDCWG